MTVSGQGMDRFYTRPDLARAYVVEVSECRPASSILFVESLVGNSAFVHPPRAIGSAGSIRCVADVLP